MKQFDTSIKHISVCVVLFRQEKQKHLYQDNIGEMFNLQTILLKNILTLCAVAMMKWKLIYELHFRYSIQILVNKVSTDNKYNTSYRILDFFGI